MKEEGKARLLITGASGLLGSDLLREAGADGIVAWSGTREGEYSGVRLRPVDLGDPAAIAGAFAEARPGVIIHAGAMARVGDCLQDPDRARRVNALATHTLAGLAREAGARLVYVSTDLAFDGETGRYTEDDPPSPLSVYARSKVEGEQAALACPGAAVVRVSLLYGPSLTGTPSSFDQQVSALREGRPLRLFADEWRTPLYLGTAARALLELAGSDVPGVWHLGGPERLSRYEMGVRTAEVLGLDPGAVVATAREEHGAGGGEPRPRDVSLDSGRWRARFPEVPWPTLAEVLQGLGRE
jgi:dTDP-4-dehydrorhamnose reductase